MMSLLLNPYKYANEFQYFSRHTILLTVAVCMILVQPLMAAEEINDNLVNARWLEKNLKNDKVLILDGGLFKWEEEGLPVTKDFKPVMKKGSFTIVKINEDVRVKLPEFLTASGDPVNNVLLEALGGDWHFGKVLAFNRAGHIPNAILLPSTDFYNKDKTFKSAEEIKRMLIYLGIRPEQKIYTYCGGEVAASVPFFAIKFLVKYPKVKLYKESEIGWLSDERELPYWTYDAPFLMRETSWLQFWGGHMIKDFRRYKRQHSGCANFRRILSGTHTFCA